MITNICLYLCVLDYGQLEPDEVENGNFNECMDENGIVWGDLELASSQYEPEDGVNGMSSTETHEHGSSIQSQSVKSVPDSHRFVELIT